MLDRLLSLLVAVCLAILIWLYARCREQETLDNVPITVQVSLTGREAEHYELEVTGPSQVPVSFIGPPSRMRELRTALQNGDMIVRLNYSVPVERQGESRCLDTLRVAPKTCTRRLGCGRWYWKGRTASRSPSADWPSACCRCAWNTPCKTAWSRCS
jgi:hypothetical protein